MGLLDTAAKNVTRARYVARQGIRTAWYGANMGAARRRASGFNRPGEAPFQPTSGQPDMARLRKAYFDLFLSDLANVEAGLYPMPNDVRVRDLPRALRSARLFHEDAAAVDERRLERNGTEVREIVPDGSNRYPAYYRQNFHYQSDGWFSDDSARVYDTQVEALFTGTADAMRRAALAEVSRELKGRDQRNVSYLDLACGTGRFLAQVLDVFPKLQADGLDLSPNYAEASRKEVRRWPQVDIIESAAEAMPFEDDSLDIICSVFLFHELPPRVRPQVIAEVMRVLKPGGLFVLADSVQFGDYPDMDGLLEYFPHGFHEPYYKGYLSYDFGAAMDEVGFTKQSETLAFLTKVTSWRKPA